jgi:hypothetical protein
VGDAVKKPVWWPSSVPFTSATALMASNPASVATSPVFFKIPTAWRIAVADAYNKWVNRPRVTATPMPSAPSGTDSGDPTPINRGTYTPPSDLPLAPGANLPSVPGSMPVATPSVPVLVPATTPMPATMPATSSAQRPVIPMVGQVIDDSGLPMLQLGPDATGASVEDGTGKGTAGASRGIMLVAAGIAAFLLLRK